MPTQNGVKIGDSVGLVYAKYGRPDPNRGIFETQEGYFLRYENILFLIDSDSKVANWVKFAN